MIAALLPHGTTNGGVGDRLQALNVKRVLFGWEDMKSRVRYLRIAPPTEYNVRNASVSQTEFVHAWAIGFCANRLARRALVRRHRRAAWAGRLHVSLCR